MIEHIGVTLNGDQIDGWGLGLEPNCRELFKPNALVELTVHQLLSHLELPRMRWSRIRRWTIVLIQGLSGRAGS